MPDIKRREFITLLGGAPQSAGSPRSMAWMKVETTDKCVLPCTPLSRNQATVWITSLQSLG